MSNKKPNRFNANETHIAYGINNWLNKIGVTDFNLKNRLKTAFLEDYGFDLTNGNQRTQNNFIDNRWKQFTEYVQKNKKFFEQSKQ